MNEIKYIEPLQESQLYNDVCQIIDGARSRIATYVNTEACLTNWFVGKRIKEDVLYNKRAEYGKQVVINLSIKLTERYGSGWSVTLGTGTCHKILQPGSHRPEVRQLRPQRKYARYPHSIRATV